MAMVAVRGRAAHAVGCGAGVYLSFQELALGDPLGAFERIAVLCLVSVIMVGNHWRWPGWYALLERA